MIRDLLTADPEEWLFILLFILLGLALMIGLLSCAIDCPYPRQQLQQVYDGQRVYVRTVTTCEENYR